MWLPLNFILAFAVLGEFVENEVEGRKALQQKIVYYKGQLDEQKQKKDKYEKVLSALNKQVSKESVYNNALSDKRESYLLLEKICSQKIEYCALFYEHWSSQAKDVSSKRKADGNPENSKIDVYERAEKLRSVSYSILYKADLGSVRLHMELIDQDLMTPQWQDTAYKLVSEVFKNIQIKEALGKAF